MNFVSPQHKLKQLNWPMVLFTMLVFSLLIKLGFWQSERALEKEQRQLRISELSQQQALSLTQVLALNGLQDGINDLPIKLDGVFIEDKVFLLDNQPDHGRLGYRVYQVITSQGYAVLVNLGWVQGSIDRNVLPTITAITGQHVITGHVREVEVGIQLQAQNLVNPTWPLRVQQIELDKFSPLIGKKLLPFVVYLDKKETIGYKKNWQAIVMPPEKHRAYAFQWFSLALAWISLMIWAAIKMSKSQSTI
ncbi:SURF1 family protein [Colwellia sp. M166]|uniref:SURF1 family protein n=1 Tax=Colwellia sp. M166 TaxID=2583805 RepID=UPI00211F379F|nr:SURF1 family protein [Colwellia sp. M166]UUO23907.1 SURF1 family protein [Colwellia sp. M166]|tara:strand:+ start:9183 stop:9929 length:747 start_codon:yes stop_codon:yes gene_type:complete